MARGVESKGVIFEVGGHRLLHGISLQVGPGRLAAIVGPSGAGKSTLLKILCGIRAPTKGFAFLDGQDAHEAGRAPDRMGYVPQDDIIHRGLKVESVLRYAAELRLAGGDDRLRTQRIERALGLVDLKARRNLKVKRLSGGQRKRVSIAVELLAEPQVLFLDEPTSGLDPGLERQLMKTLRSLAQGPRTVIVTTHIMESMSVVDLLVVVYAGTLAYAGPPAKALDFFRVRDLRALFDKLSGHKPAAWHKRYLDQRTQLNLPPLAPAQQTPPSPRTAAPQNQGPATTDVNNTVEQQLAALKQKIHDPGGA